MVAAVEHLVALADGECVAGAVDQTAAAVGEQGQGVRGPVDLGGGIALVLEAPCQPQPGECAAQRLDAGVGAAFELAPPAPAGTHIGAVGEHPQRSATQHAVAQAQPLAAGQAVGDLAVEIAQADVGEAGRRKRQAQVAQGQPGAAGRLGRGVERAPGAQGRVPAVASRIGGHLPLAVAQRFLLVLQAQARLAQVLRRGAGWLPLRPVQLGFHQPVPQAWGFRVGGVRLATQQGPVVGAQKLVVVGGRLAARELAQALLFGLEAVKRLDLRATARCGLGRGGLAPGGGAHQCPHGERAPSPRPWGQATRARCGGTGKAGHEVWRHMGRGLCGGAWAPGRQPEAARWRTKKTAATMLQK